jgi:uncharacterized protein (TIGR03435 family)
MGAVLLAGFVSRVAPGAESRKEFEVVSVKRSLDVEHVMQSGWRYLRYEGTRFSANVSVGDYIAWAFPEIRSDRWDTREPDILTYYFRIDAVAPAGTTIDEARFMLRTVLTDRLGLQYSFEDRSTPVFNLVAGKGPLKLTPADGPTQNPRMNAHGPASMDSQSAPLSVLAGFLSGYAGRPVVDKTGIQGNFVLNIDWHVEMHASMSEGHGLDPTVAIRGVKDLGLNLEPATEMRQYMVIRHMNREPTPN